MYAGALLVWLVAQSEGGGSINTGGIAIVVLLVGTLGGGAGLTALLLARKQGRQVDATTTKVEADAANTLTQANESFARMQRDAQNDVERALRDMRSEVREAQAKAAEAVAARAQAEATLARVKADESEKRHQLVNEHAAELVQWELRTSKLEEQIAVLREEVGSLRAQLNAARDGRRHDDQGTAP